jgi:AcrR family transcriptional regulator
MVDGPGLRERKKLQQRHRLADVAAELFATRGYDAVSMGDVARAADVSGQTVYNYFPVKEDLVLDRADEIRERYGRVVREREAGTTPASALRPLVHEDVDRFLGEDPLAKGEFPALCVESAVLRRAALEYREQQTRTVTEAMVATEPALHPVAALAHAAALIAIVQHVADEIGGAVLADADRAPVADRLRRDADLALDGLERQYAALVAPPPSSA